MRAPDESQGRDTDLRPGGFELQNPRNNDIATRLFVSPRTVQPHLTHVYTTLGLTSRAQLVQEAARHVAGKIEALTGVYSLDY
nr:helix-turn-helix transcriptional regulator [Mycobacterium sp.]